LHLRETHDAESVVTRNQKTKLISFFLACAQGLTGIDGVPAKNCLYLDFPQYFRFDQKTKLWVGRKNHIKRIGRIDSVLFDQFKADFMDKRLRDLRCCNEVLPQLLSEDMMLGRAMFYTLKSIDNCFQHHRLSLLDYPTLPQLHEFEVFRDLGERQLLDDARSRLYVIETSYTRGALDDVLATAATMTDEHRSFVATVLAQIYEHASGKAYFLQGEGGSGKSYVSQILLAKVRDKGDIALAVASSG
ncbi:hypothetical protein DYB28_012722, partial [Aphanomyces astaci]